jgi:hypothetical protein
MLDRRVPSLRDSCMRPYAYQALSCLATDMPSLGDWETTWTRDMKSPLAFGSLGLQLTMTQCNGPLTTDHFIVLRQNLLDRLGAFDADEFLVEAAVEVAQSIGIKSQ